MSDLIEIGWGIIAIAVKMKLYLYAIITAFFSGAVKYVQKKRNGEKVLFRDYLLFCIVACSITLTALTILKWRGMDIDALAYMIMFWCGISADYLFLAVQELIEVVMKRFIKRNGE